MAFLLLISTAIEANEPTSAIVDVTWSLSLDAEGHVSKLATTDKSVPKLHLRLENTIRGWHFSPGKVNGQPAATDTQLQTRLKISPVDDGMQVRVIGAGTGPGYRSIGKTHYSDYAADKHMQGCVVLEVRYEERGNVTGRNNMRVWRR